VLRHEAACFRSLGLKDRHTPVKYDEAPTGIGKRGGLLRRERY
jgi:hypothetical protein